MRDVFIIGLGQTEVGEHWETSLRHLAWMAVDAALRDSGFRADTLPGTGNRTRILPDALYVSNILAGQLSGQEHLGSLVADFCGLRGIEAATIEAAGAGGGMALRQAYLAVASGMLDTAMAVGVEKFTDTVGNRATAALATATDGDWEAAQGATPTALAALIMRRYMHDFDCAVADFAGFSVNAHANAKTNKYAMFRNTVTPEAFAKAAMVCDPVNMFDTAPDADGAAAVIVASGDFVRAHPAPHPLIRIAGSAAATDTLAVHDRPDRVRRGAAFHRPAAREFLGHARPQLPHGTVAGRHAAAGVSVAAHPAGDLPVCDPRGRYLLHAAVWQGVSRACRGAAGRGAHLVSRLPSLTLQRQPVGRRAGDGGHRLGAAAALNVPHDERAAHDAGEVRNHLAQEHVAAAAGARMRHERHDAPRRLGARRAARGDTGARRDRADHDVASHPHGRKVRHSR